jgi:hypothetical protein
MQATVAPVLIVASRKRACRCRRILGGAIVTEWAETACGIGRAVARPRDRARPRRTRASNGPSSSAGSARSRSGTARPPDLRPVTGRLIRPGPRRTPRPPFANGRGLAGVPAQSPGDPGRPGRDPPRHPDKCAAVGLSAGRRRVAGVGDLSSDLITPRPHPVAKEWCLRVPPQGSQRPDRTNRQAHIVSAAAISL